MLSPEKLPPLDADAYKPLYVQLSEILTEYIAQAGLGEGDLLPSESELISAYGVSRHTVRQAIQLLETQEMVRRFRGKGTFVTESKGRDQVRGFQNLEERLVELGKEPANILLRYQKVTPSHEWIEKLGVELDDEYVLITRLKLADGEKVALEDRLLKMEVARHFSEDDFKNNEPVWTIIERKPEFRHRRVIYTISSSPLTESEAQTLGVDPASPVIRRYGAYYNAEEVLVVLSRVTFLSDKTELRYEFNYKDDNWGVVTIT